MCHCARRCFLASGVVGCARAFARFRFLVVLWCHAGFDFVRVCSCAPCLVGGMRGQLGGATPLTMASKYGHAGIVAALIEGGADVGLAMVSDPSWSPPPVFALQS